MATLAVAVVALCFAALPAHANTASYGDVTITIDSPGTRVRTNTGYFSYPVTIDNRSETSRRVTIAVEGRNDSYESAVATGLTFSTNVGPEATVHTAFYLPPSWFAGDAARVTIDGRPQQQSITLGYATHGPAVVPVWQSRNGTAILAFASSAVTTELRDALQDHASAEPRISLLEVERAERETSRWVASWLAYSRYAVVLVDAGDWTRATPSVRDALAGYARAGGTLVIVGDGVRLADVLGSQPTHDRDAFHPMGFGHVRIARNADLVAAPGSVVSRAALSVSSFATGFDTVTAERLLPVSPKDPVPIAGTVAILVLTAIVIGPLNIIVLARLRRRAMLFITTPIIGLLFAGAMFGFGMLHDGITTRVMSRSVTILDHASDRGTTLAHWACYAPLPPGDGLSVAGNVEVSPVGRYSYDVAGVAFTVDRGARQVFRGGMVRSRIPSHLILRTDEPRRERVDITREGERVFATNGLGVAIVRLAYADAEGTIHTATATAIAPGDRVALVTEATPVSQAQSSPRHPQNPTELHRAINDAIEKPFAVVPTNGYVALLEQDPFTEVDIGTERSRDDMALVIGTFGEAQP